MKDGLELEDLLEKHHGQSFGWALSCCAQDRQDAEDVLQTVYLKILEGRARYDKKSAFRTWLFSVIRKTAIDARRRQVLYRLRLNYLKNGLGQDLSNANACSLDEQSELQVRFRHVLSELPRRQREVLQLVFYHELTIEGAGEVMGVSLGSARTHYDRAKKRVRELLKNSEVGHEPRPG